MSEIEIVDQLKMYLIYISLVKNGGADSSFIKILTPPKKNYFQSSYRVTIPEKGTLNLSTSVNRSYLANSLTLANQ